MALRRDAGGPLLLRLIAGAFGLGLIFNAAPGPVFAETVRRGVRGGFRPALAVQLGSLAGDALWAVLGLTGVGLLLRLESLRRPTGVAGVVYLLWLAWVTWRASTSELAVDLMQDRALDQKALGSGALLSLTNPQNVAYWAAMGSALGAIGVENPTTVDYAAFFAGFMLASIVWSFLFAALVDRVLGHAGIRWARIAYRVCALAFLALALSSARELWIGFREAPRIQSPRDRSGKP
jgi:chemosensory pili system protein ChpE